MKTKNFKILVSLSVIIIVLGLWQFWVMFRNMQEARQELREARSQILQVEIEKNELQAQLSEKESELSAARSQLQTFAVLKKHNVKLLQIKEELEQRVADLEKEKELIEAKLYSLSELRLAMRHAKAELRNQRVKEYLARKEQQRQLDAQRLAMGNRGYLTKEGTSTYRPLVKIEVRPSN